VKGSVATDPPLVRICNPKVYIYGFVIHFTPGTASGINAILKQEGSPQVENTCGRMQAEAFVWQFVCYNERHDFYNGQLAP